LTKGITTAQVEWERSDLYCPHCGLQGLWIMVERSGTYPSKCPSCAESFDINPWRAFDMPKAEGSP
jgi:hypothetical protein